MINKYTEIAVLVSMTGVELLIPTLLRGLPA
jgi:hypothetical protein